LIYLGRSLSTSHYAIATGLYGHGMMFPGMLSAISGDGLAILDFFVWLVAHIPAITIAASVMYS